MAAPRYFEATPEGERAYIEQRWAGFASCARSGFERFGRGVVLVTVRPPDAPAKAGTVEYVSDSAAAKVWPGGGWPEPATGQAVKAYDPEKGFLVLVLDYEFRTCRLHRFESDEPLPESQHSP